QPGQQTLRFAERVSIQVARLAALLVVSPPSVNLLEDGPLVVPLEKRMAERRFSDEGMAPDWLERRAGRIGMAPVIPGTHPAFPLTFDPTLSRAENMARRMEGDFDTKAIERRAVIKWLDDRAWPQPLL